MKTLITTAVVIFLSVWLSSFSKAVKLESLLLYLPFDEGSGNEAKDLSGNGFNGTLHGPKWVDGKFNKALEFDGKDNYVSVEPIGVEPEAITIEFWFSPAQNLDSSSLRADLMYALNGCCRPHLTINRENDGAFGFYVEHGGVQGGAEGPGTQVMTNLTSWKAAEWYHFAGAADEAEVKVYVNGKLENKTKAPGDKLHVRYGEYGISIGAGNQGAANFFSGKMDEIRIWSRILTENEIRKAFAGTLMAVLPIDKLAITWGSIKNE